MTPDASGKFKGISVPSIPWSEKGHGMTEFAQSYTGILRTMRVLVGESVYENAQVSVSDGILWIEFTSTDDLESVAVSLDALGIRNGTSHEPATP